MFDFSKANDEQKEAIKYTDGALLITAGPGTGKTFTLVQKAVYLIQEKHVSHEQIMIATFTEKAAKEIVTRITNELSERNIPVDVNEMYIGTFHSICLRFIKDNLEYTDFKKNYRMLDSFDQQYLIFQNYFRKFKPIPDIDALYGKKGVWYRAQEISYLVNTLNEEMVDKTLVVPPEYARVLDANIKVHFLEDTGTTLNTLDNSDFNIIISNTQKIIIKKKHKEDGAGTKLFTLGKQSETSSIIDEALQDIYGDEEITPEDLIFNQRFKKLCRLNQIGIYVDEAHHLFGKELEKALRKGTDTSLRNTINLLATELEHNNTSVLACYNYTGTPYVKNKILPEVVYSYGLKNAIAHKYLKEVGLLQGFDNVKDKEFLKNTIQTFWQEYGGKTYEGLPAKLAIFASRIAEITDEVQPAVEEICDKLGIPRDKILVNVGDTTVTKAEAIRDFNNLDVVGTIGSQKQIILLVDKGREGWNCRSLFGVAMFRSPKSKVFVLQATMRCLRQITDEQQKAMVFLSKDNLEERNYQSIVFTKSTQFSYQKEFRIFLCNATEQIKAHIIVDGGEIYRSVLGSFCYEDIIKANK